MGLFYADDKSSDEDGRRFSATITLDTCENNGLTKRTSGNEKVLIGLPGPVVVLVRNLKGCSWQTCITVFPKRRLSVAEQMQACV